MPCYHPLRAFQTVSGDVVFIERGNIARTLELPCGRCVGCRLERSRQWAVRIMHEASLYPMSSFATLTYDEKHVDARGCLVYNDFQLFMKRLRKRFGPTRFFVVGEYGSENGRPHYHAALFGLWPADLKMWRNSFTGFPLYRSKVVEEIWAKGHVEIGSLTFESAAYMARYVLEKVTGDLAKSHYERVDENGEIYHLPSEFARMSLRPGIGHEWFKRYGNTVVDHDRVISNGHPAKPPRYYDKMAQKMRPEDMEFNRFMREKRGREAYADNTEERLAVRETVEKARLAFKKRKV